MTTTRRLTPQQTAVLALIAEEHLTYAQAGERLGISPRTVAQHVWHIRGRLGIPHTRRQFRSLLYGMGYRERAR